jgi:hypothetical protein
MRTAAPAPSARPFGFHVRGSSALRLRSPGAAAVPDRLDATVTTADDVSRLDSTPAIGLREWLSGVRPVAGAIAASSLMLLACSWFAFSSGLLGPRHDVGKVDPVRIDGVAPLRAVTSSTASASAAGHARPEVGTPRAHHRGAAAATPEIQQSAEAGPQLVTSAAPGPVPAGAKFPSAAPAAPTAAATTPVAPPVVPDVTSTLPPPLDELPNVTMPPITAPVAVPSLSVPPVLSVTTSVGTP